MLAGRAVHTSRMAAAPGRTNSEALVPVPVFCGTGISTKAFLVLLQRTPCQVFCLSYFKRWDWQPGLVFRGIPSTEGKTASIGTLNPYLHITSNIKLKSQLEKKVAKLKFLRAVNDVKSDRITSFTRGN